MNPRCCILTLLSFSFLGLALSQSRPAYLDPDLPAEERARDLVSRFTLEEKISQLNFDAPAVERLGVPAYNWWNEALHGVARHGRATVFPQAIALAATWDPDLIYQVASAISDEGRAKFNASQALGNRGRYAGLTFWSPNVNIFRDPRWGRGQETYGEDPFLTSRIGVAFVKGMQGDHPQYLKTAACAKHFAVHSGPEGDRHHFNAEPPLKDFRETYLPAFQALVQEANVEAVMCAYNRTYGEPSCGSPMLLHEILREEWGFQGHVVSDCWALVDFHQTHNVTTTPQESAALAFNSGVDVNCGSSSPFLKQAIEEGLIDEAQIDSRLTNLLQTRFRLGLFDDPENVPWTELGPDVVDSPRHRELARTAAAKSLVLLKNDGVLPLSPRIRSLYVMGPNAADVNVLLGNYYGLNPNFSTVLEGIAGKVDAGTTVEYRQGFLLDRENLNPVDWTSGPAHDADAIVVAMGLSPLLEGEEGESILSPTMSDREDIRLPANQINFLRRVRQAGDKPIIAVVFGGSAIAMPEVHEMANAVLYVWYPGQEGGNATAAVIFGEISPSGRLPVTFPMSVEDLPPYGDYSMQDRTYKYMSAVPLYPFGFGLSYTRFSYQDLKVSRQRLRPGESLQIEATVSNIGDRTGEEVAQLYLTNLDAPFRVPHYELKGFQRLLLEPGQSQTVRFVLEPEDFLQFDENGMQVFDPGEVRLALGGASPHPRSQELGAPEPVAITVSLEQ